MKNFVIGFMIGWSVRPIAKEVARQMVERLEGAKQNKDAA